MDKLLVLGSYGDMTGGTETVLNSVVPRLKKNFDEILVVAPRKRRRFFRDFVDDNITVKYQRARPNLCLKSKMKVLRSTFKRWQCHVKISDVLKIVFKRILIFPLPG